METTVTIFELVISIVPLAMALIGGWVSMKTTVTALQKQLEYVQKELTEEKEGNKTNFINLNHKIDSLFGKIGEVRELILKNNTNGKN